MTLDESNRLMLPGGGIEYREQAAKGSVFAAVKLLRYSTACLSLPKKTSEILRSMSNRGTQSVSREDCFPFFGSDVQDELSIRRLQLSWIRGVAESGLAPAAAFYWQMTDILRTEGVQIRDGSGLSPKDHEALAHSLMISAAASGDFNSNFALLVGYFQGDRIDKNEALASKYARSVMTLNAEYSKIPWLKALAEKWI